MPAWWNQNWSAAAPWIAAFSTVLVTLLWVHLSPQKSVKRTAGHSVRIAVALLIVNAAWYFLLCHVFEISGYGYLVATAIVFLVTASLDWTFSPAGDDLIGFAAVMAVATPLYIMKQLVLGFPDREHVIPTPDPPPPAEPPEPKAQIGITVSALRPMGTVEIAGEHFNASSSTGRMIEAGRRIRSTGHRGRVLLVEELPDGNTQ